MPKKRAKRRPLPPDGTHADGDTGKVIGRKGPVYFVLDQHGQTCPCVARGSGKKAVIGDEVEFVANVASEMADGLLTAVLPRRSQLKRADALGRRAQILAANVDKIIIVVSPTPPMREGLIDRYLVAASSQLIPPAIVFNKLDLVSAEERSGFDARLDVYRNIGIECLSVSAHDKTGLEQLVQLLSHGTSMLVGHSGVGKTSLINQVCPGVEERVQAISEASGRGQHTTTTSWIYSLPGGGQIIDSPGIRSFGLWGIAENELREHFVEFRAFADECRFGDCQHLREPKCAVRAAVEAGLIHARRYASYVSMRETLLGEADGPNR
ncbi:MAG: ribosome small subunit-dependent GTPase A [Myxococcota bacterium]|nr:ribosome small subunit-dependent GTPase A [Myxococcota bacterium]